METYIYADGRLAYKRITYDDFFIEKDGEKILNLDMLDRITVNVPALAFDSKKIDIIYCGKEYKLLKEYIDLDKNIRIIVAY